MFNKVAIYHATAGAGHKSAALALGRAFEQTGMARQVDVVDALDYTSRPYTRLYRKTYLDMVGKAPHLVGYTYDKLDTPWEQERRRLFFDRTQAGKFVELLENSDADLAVCTHFLPSELISYLRRKGRIKTPQAIVVTDFDVHAMWLCRHYEQFFVAREEARVYLETLGIRPDALHVTGIPVNPVFAEAKCAFAMRRKHGLEMTKPTVLLSAGGYGVGPVGELLHSMLKAKTPMQIAAICGRNEKLKAQVEQIAANVPAGNPVSIKPVGFTTDMDEYMSAADLVVGKPGGLTTSEALSKGLPFVVVNPIPGQEDRNSDHLLQNGAGIRCSHPEMLHWHLDQVVGNGERLAVMQQNARKLGRPTAAFDIVSTLVRSHRAAA
jgi:processive 1,2-diacylglycerol beta-glucosyltransferase